MHGRSIIHAPMRTIRYYHTRFIIQRIMTNSALSCRARSIAERLIMRAGPPGPAHSYSPILRVAGRCQGVHNVHGPTSRPITAH